MIWSALMILGGNASIQSRGYDLFRELVAARAHEKGNIAIR